MKKIEIEKAIKKYNNACDEILQAFCKKQGFDSHHIWWLQGKRGGSVNIGKEWYKFKDILFDMEKNIPKGEIIKYYDYIERTFLRQLNDFQDNFSYMSYANWLEVQKKNKKI